MKIPTIKELIDRLGWTAAINELKVILYRLNEKIGDYSFLGLTDTPDTYEGQGGKVLSVKNDETGVEFTTNSGGSTGDLQDVSDIGNTTTNSLNALGFYAFDSLTSKAGAVDFEALKIRTNDVNSSGVLWIKSDNLINDEFVILQSPLSDGTIATEEFVNDLSIVSGTFTTITSITITNGIITAITGV